MVKVCQKLAKVQPLRENKSQVKMLKEKAKENLNKIWMIAACWIIPC